MDMHIRDAVPGDAPTLVAILIASKQASWPQLVDAHDLDAAFWTARWHGYLTEGSRAQMSRGDGCALLAEIDGRPVAFAGYHHTTRHGADAELESIYVLKEAQRRGLGTALLRLVAARLVADGSRSLCVGYDPRNPYRSFYTNHGAVELNAHWALWRDLHQLAESR